MPATAGGHRELEMETLRADVACIKGVQVVQIMKELAVLTRLARAGRGGEAEGGKHKYNEKEPINNLLVHKDIISGDEQQTCRAEAS